MRRKEIAGNRISPIVGRSKAATVLIDLIIPVKIKKPRYVPPELQLLRNYKSQLSDKSRVIAIPEVQFFRNQGSQLPY